MPTAYAATPRKHHSNRELLVLLVDLEEEAVMWTVILKQRLSYTAIFLSIDVCATNDDECAAAVENDFSNQVFQYTR
jgi:hypothetical protein